MKIPIALTIPEPILKATKPAVKATKDDFKVSIAPLLSLNFFAKSAIFFMTSAKTFAKLAIALLTPSTEPALLPVFESTPANDSISCPIILKTEPKVDLKPSQILEKELKAPFFSNAPHSSLTYLTMLSMALPAPLPHSPILSIIASITGVKASSVGSNACDISSLKPAQVSLIVFAAPLEPSAVFCIALSSISIETAPAETASLNEPYCCNEGFIFIIVSFKEAPRAVLLSVSCPIFSAVTLPEAAI